MFGDGNFHSLHLLLFLHFSPHPAPSLPPVLPPSRQPLLLFVPLPLALLLTVMGTFWGRPESKPKGNYLSPLALFCRFLLSPPSSPLPGPPSVAFWALKGRQSREL